VNIGFAGGNNMGIKSSNGDYIVFLNNDTEVDRNWLRELVRAIRFDPVIGAAQSKLLSIYDRKTINCCGGLMDRYGWTHKLGNGETDYGQHDHREIFYAMGAAMIVKRSVLDRVGVFDSDFGMYFEDVDLSWRIRLGGYKVVFAPKSIVLHIGGATVKGQSTTSEFFNLRNMITTLLKNYELHNVVKRLPITLAFVSITATFLMLKGEINRAIAYINAVLYNLTTLARIWRKRVKVLYLIREVSDRTIQECMLKKPLFINEVLRLL
jgi:hypothetical protein